MGIESTDEADKNKVDVPQGLDSDFGVAPYWSNGTIATNAKFYLLSVIATFSNMDGLRFSLQYGFSKGMTEFKQEGYDATVSELDGNLIGINIVVILDKRKITKDTCIIVLSYLMFLKRKRTGDIEARGYANGQ